MIVFKYFLEEELIKRHWSPLIVREYFVAKIYKSLCDMFSLN